MKTKKIMYLILFVLFEIISNLTVTNAYDTCYPGYDYSFSFRCYGEDEYCCNSDFDCCKSLQPGAIFGIIAGCVFGLGMILACVCGACKIKNRRHSPVVMQPNHRLQVSYISYNEHGQSNHNIYEHSTDPSHHIPEPPPYSTIQGDFSKPPPYSSIYSG